MKMIFACHVKARGRGGVWHKFITVTRILIFNTG